MPKKKSFYTTETPTIHMISTFPLSSSGCCLRERKVESQGQRRQTNGSRHALKAAVQRILRHPGAEVSFSLGMPAFETRTFDPIL